MGIVTKILAEYKGGGTYMRAKPRTAVVTAEKATVSTKSDNANRGKKKLIHLGV